MSISEKLVTSAENLISIKGKMTAIADAIRDKTGGTEKLGLDEMAVGVGEVFEAGQQAGYEAGQTDGIEQGKQAECDRFWDVFQENGARTDYSNAFYNWKGANYKPKYVPQPTIANQMFAGMKYIYDRVIVNMSNTTACTGMFASSGIYDLTITSTATTTWNTNMFSYAQNLENLEVIGVIAKTFSVAQSTILTHDSLMNLINALYDYSGSTDTYKIQLGSANLAKLTDEEKTLIQSKGWTYA